MGRQLKSRLHLPRLHLPRLHLPRLPPPAFGSGGHTLLPEFVPVVVALTDLSLRRRAMQP